METVAAVNYVLQQSASTAAEACTSLRTKHITPHTIRRETAMALLQAGVDVAVIALYLGHESIETTHIYVEADLAMKERPWKNSVQTTPLRPFRHDYLFMRFR